MNILSSRHTPEAPRLILCPMAEEYLQTVVNWRNASRVALMDAQAREGKFTISEQIKWFHEARDDRIDYINRLKVNGTPIRTCGLIKKATQDLSHVWRRAVTLEMALHWELHA